MENVCEELLPTEENVEELIPVIPTEENIEELLTVQFQKLDELETKSKYAYDSAEKAKKSASEAKAKKAGKLWGVLADPEAVRSNQTAINDLATGLSHTVEAMQVSFEYQRALAKITKNLYDIAVCDIAMYEITINKISEKLRDASKGKLSETARRELTTLIIQLKRKEDLLFKQEKLAKKVKSIDAKDIEQDRLLKEGIDKDAEQDRLLKEGIDKDAEQDRLLKEGIDKDAEQDRLIQEGIDKDAEQDRLIEELQTQDDVQEQSISDNREIIDLCQMQIQALQEENASLTEKLYAINYELQELHNSLSALSSKPLAITGTAMAAAALILAVVQFFL